MTAPEVFGLLAVLLMTGVSAVLAATETSFTHISQARAEVLGDRSDGRAAELLGFLEHRSRHLRPVLLALLACRLGAAGITAVLVQARFGGAWVLPALAVLVAVVFVVAEAMPKTWALRRTDEVSLWTVRVLRLLADFPPFRWATYLLTAVSERLLPRSVREDAPLVSEEELLAVADRALAAQSIDEEEHDLIESVIAFGDTLVREVMVPRPDMVSIDSRCSVQVALEQAVSHGYSRVPVCDAGIDAIVGVVHVKDLVIAQLDGRGDCVASDLARNATFVPETKPADDLMRQMQSERFHMAMVVDEYGGTAGLVTMEDLLEEVFGEIVDEFDREEPLSQPLACGGLRVHGRMPVDELNELLDETLPDGDWDTVGGLIFDALGHVPEVGETVELAGRQFGVEQVVGRRITRVRIGAPTGRQ